MASVFVSHRRADANVAHKLAVELESAGHVVWLDDRDIAVGDSILDKMNNELIRAEYVVLCYSSAGVETPWISREWLSTLARQLDRTGVRILPVRLTGGSPPAILADIRYADLVTDWNTGVKDLLAAIR